MKTQVQLVLATIGLTLLIWVYADLTSQEVDEVTLTVRLAVPVGSDSVIYAETAPVETETGFDTAVSVPVQATVVGPKAALADLEHLRRSKGLLIEVPVLTTEAGSPDVIRTIDIRPYLVPWARERSLRIVALSRTAVQYRLDHFVRVDLTVEVTAGNQAEKLRGPPLVEPPQVRARLLASQRDMLPTDDRRLEVSIEQDLRAGSEDSFEKSLAGLRWHGIEATYTPSIVKISVQRREGVATIPITSIPTYEMWPAYRPEQGQFRIEWEDGEAPLQHIEVSVPAGTPGLPTNKDVTAYVTITPEDLKQASAAARATDTAPAEVRASVRRPVRFVFSEEFKGVRVVSLPSEVRFRVVRVDPPVPAP